MQRVLTYAPLVVLVVSSPDISARISLREQETVSGAVCMNLLNAIHAHGYGANLVTGWTADSRAAAEVFGLKSHERVVGVVHIGTIAEPPAERARPDLANVVTFWKSPA
jgi:nitroreductase